MGILTIASLIWIFSASISIAIIVCYFVMCSKIIKIEEKLNKLVEQNNENNDNLEALLKVALMIKNQNENKKTD